MLDILSEVIRNIVIMVILAGLLEMLLPSGGMRRYVRLVIGLFLIYILVNPILQIAEGEGFELTAGLPASGETVSVFAEKGKEIAEQGRQKALQDYRTAIGRQVRALLRLEKDITVGDILVNVEDKAGRESYGQIISIVIVVGKGTKEENAKGPPPGGGNVAQVQPVQVELNIGETGESGKVLNTAWSRRIKGIVADFYGLSGEQVEIREWRR